MNGLNDAKNFAINGKFYQRIGIIYLSEIENWDKIKGLSHWTNIIVTDSAFPIGAKHYSFVVLRLKQAMYKIYQILNTP